MDKKIFTVEDIAEEFGWSIRKVRTVIAVVNKEFSEDSKDYIVDHKKQSGQTCKAYTPEYLDFIKVAEDVKVMRKPKGAPEEIGTGFRKGTKNTLVGDDGIFPDDEGRKKLKSRISKKGKSTLPFSEPGFEKPQLPVKLPEIPVLNNTAINWYDVFEMLEAGCNLAEVSACIRVAPDYLADQCEVIFNKTFPDLAIDCSNAGLAKIRMAMQRNILSENPNALILAMAVRARIPDGSGLQGAKSDMLITLNGKQIDLTGMPEDKVDYYLELVEKERESKDGRYTEATVVEEETKTSET